MFYIYILSDYFTGKGKTSFYIATYGHRLGGILGRGLRTGGGSGLAALLAHAGESRKGLGSVTLKINTQHTHSGAQ